MHHNISIVFTTIILLLMVVFSPIHAMDMKSPQKIVVHLGNDSNGLHATFMVVNLVTIFIEKEVDTTFFVNLEGVRLLDYRVPANLKRGTSPEIGNLYQKFIEAGGKIVVCPNCAMAAGLETTHLRKGVKFADHDLLATLFFEADKLIDC